MQRVKLFIFATALIFMLNGNAPDTGNGIQFTSSKFSEAKKEAQQTGKTIFIDSYTQWCGPCKKMASQVFTNSEVGNYFNQHFVSMKMDMEETSGMLIGRRYGVNFYPTLLFITPQGTLIRKEVGYKSKDDLLRVARDVVRYN